MLVVSLSGCVTVNMVGSETLDDLSRAQKQMRERAAELSITAWKTVASGSFFGSITGMLINGRGEPEGPGLVADSKSRRSTAVAYVEQTEQQYVSTGAQLNAIVLDLRQKTSEARALVEATQLVVLSYKGSSNEVDSTMVVSSAAIIGGIADLEADRKIVKQSIANARKQQSTFQIAEQAYRQRNPSADTTPITLEITSFGRQIDLMVTLSHELSEVKIS
jgi:hypothetical protein